MQEIQKTWVWSLDQEDPMEKEMATHSGILAWKIPWTEEPGRLESVSSQKVGHNGTHTHTRHVSNSNHNHSIEVTWAWAGSRRWWRTRWPGELQSMGSQRVRHDWVTEQQQFKETEAQRYWATNLPKVFQLMETRFELWKYGSRILLFNHV